MNSEKIPQLIDRSSSTLAEKFAAMKEHAEHVIATEVESMKANGEAHELTDDEEQMLLAYKRFHAKSKPGSVFQWRTPRVQQSIVAPPPAALLVHPQEV